MPSVTMPYRNISDDLRQRAIVLREEHELKNSVVAGILGVSERSVARWVQSVEEERSILPTPRIPTGRPSVLTPEHVDTIATILKAHPDTYLDELQLLLCLNHDVIVSSSTIHRTIQFLGYSHKKLKHAASERSEEKRKEWKEFAASRLIASMLVFVDETSKDKRTETRHYGYAKIGERATVSTPFGRGTRFSVAAALSVNGYLAHLIVEGSVNSNLFFDFIVNDVVSLDYSPV